MAKYQLTEFGVRDTESNASIPEEIESRHWRKYLKWVDAGNTPDPIPASPPPKTKKEKLKDLIGAESPNSQVLKAVIVLLGEQFGMSQNQIEQEIEDRM